MKKFTKAFGFFVSWVASVVLIVSAIVLPPYMVYSQFVTMKQIHVIIAKNIKPLVWLEKQAKEWLKL
ncbi:hypothetical protein HpBGD77_04530 [Helicobacter pylori]